jgi:predicted porin
MRLKTLAIASAFAALAPQMLLAQTTTTGFYGRANLSVESQKDGKVSTSKMVDNSSRLGFKTERAIGSGLTAGVVLEAGTNLTSGSTASELFAREASARLSGGFGEIRLGRLAANTAYFATADYISNHNHDTGTSSDAFYDFLASMKNAVGYTAPKLGDLQLQAQVGMKNGSGTGTSVTGVKVSPVALSANYDMGPLGLGFGYERGGNTGGKAISANTVRLSYSSGPFIYGAYVQKSSGPSNDRTAWRLSAMYTLGQNEFHLNYGAAGDRANVANTGATQTTMAYNFNLDKATKLYAFVTQVSNEKSAKYNVTNAGTNFRSVGAGFRMNF